MKPSELKKMLESALEKALVRATKEIILFVPWSLTENYVSKS